jgi:hypothetical protein
MTLEDIAAKYEHPIIGIIGAASPMPGYDSSDGFRLGYWLRDLVEAKGTLFTGGVKGVGLDVYGGIVDYCNEKGAQDKFFVLIPEGDYQPLDYMGISPGNNLRIERAGRDMFERRLYVGDIADILIMANGASGTVDEALMGILRGKEVLCLENTGGAAGLFARIKRGEIGDLTDHLDYSLISIFETISELFIYLKSTLSENQPSPSLGDQNE